ncbi:MAG: YraN family protein [Gammaproteobacteria bacterium]
MSWVLSTLKRNKGRQTSKNRGDGPRNPTNPTQTTLFPNESQAPHIERGVGAEEAACAFLVAEGLRPVCRNYRCRLGELDLVMEDGGSLVVVEVRYRNNDRYGGAPASITPQKQTRIVAATRHYLSCHKTQRPIRFDVVAITGNATFEWIKNAFQS